MQRFQEISLLYDHSQIPIFLARNASTFEILSLQRIPISSFIAASTPTQHSSDQQLINIKNSIDTFPFIENWSKIPRHPNLLTLREVILEENQLFLISERYNETLVRFLRRNGVLNRVQIRNHAMNTDGDEKHDRAAAALVARWESEGVLPDEYDDSDFFEAIGITSDQTSFNNVAVVNDDRKRSRRLSSPIVTPISNRRNSTIFPEAERRRSCALVSFVSPAGSKAQLSRDDETNNKIANPLVVSSSTVGATTKKEKKNQKRKTSFSHQFLPSALKAQRKMQSEETSSGAFIFQNSLNFSGETSPAIAPISSSFENDGNHALGTSGGFEKSDEEYDDNDDISDDERDRRMLFNASKTAEAGANYDVVPDHDLIVRHSDIYRVPLSDDEVRVILFQILSALEKLHQQGFAHGSISPKHLVFTARNDLTSLKLTCFRKLTDLKRVAKPTSSSSRNNNYNNNVDENKRQQKEEEDDDEGNSDEKEKKVADQQSNYSQEIVRSFNLKSFITSAINDSLAIIAEEEEWRKRRRSFADGSPSRNNQFQQQLQHSLRFANNNNNISTGLLSNTTSNEATTHENSRSIKFLLGSEPTSNTEMMKNKLSSASKQFFLGPDVVQEWENEDEEILINCDLNKNNNLTVDQEELAFQFPNARFYEREDVKAWLTVTHAPPEVILGYAPKMVHQQSNKNQQSQQDEQLQNNTNKNKNSNNNIDMSNKRGEQIATPPGDIWSSALTILELYAARPLVYGETPRDVFFRAASQFCGCPSHVADPDFHRWAMHATNAPLPTAGINAVPLSSVVPMATNKKVLDLLSKMLKLDPSERITASDALMHPFFSMEDEEGGDSDEDGYY